MDDMLRILVEYVVNFYLKILCVGCLGMAIRPQRSGSIFL